MAAGAYFGVWGGHQYARSGSEPRLLCIPAAGVGGSDEFPATGPSGLLVEWLTWNGRFGLATGAGRSTFARTTFSLDAPIPAWAKAIMAQPIAAAAMQNR